MKIIVAKTPPWSWNKLQNITHRPTGGTQIPPTHTSILSARWQPYYPESRIQRGSPIQVNIETTPDYIDLSKCYMKFKLKITKANRADIADKKVIPINNFLHSMIKQMSIKLNNTLVTQQNDTYAYKAYMESLLSYPKIEPNRI